MNLFFQLTYTEQKPSETRIPVLKQATQPTKECKSQIQLNKKSLQKTSLQNKKARNEWNYNQARSYIQFLIKYQGYYIGPASQKKIRNINILMSQSIKTRNPKQCYAHHQKMMKRYGSFQAILGQFTYLLRKSIAQPQKYINIAQKRSEQPQRVLQEIRSVSTLCSPQEQQLLKLPEVEEGEELDDMKQSQKVDFIDQRSQ